MCLFVERESMPLDLVPVGAIFGGDIQRVGQEVISEIF